MLNKRIKSLLVAGLLVFSMAGGVFAEGDSAAADKNGVATITNPKFDAEGKRDITKAILNGDIKVSLTRKEGNLYDILISWDSTKVNVTGMKSTFENGTIGSENYFDPEYHCANIIKEGNIYKVSLENLGGMGVTELLGKLVKLEIYYEAVKSSDPVDPNPEKITDEPVTGDTGTVLFVGGALVSVAALYALNKKEDEE
jgi:hypothetical protein